MTWFERMARFYFDSNRGTTRICKLSLCRPYKRGLFKLHRTSKEPLRIEAWLKGNTLKRTSLILDLLFPPLRGSANQLQQNPVRTGFNNRRLS